MGLANFAWALHGISQLHMDFFVKNVAEDWPDMGIPFHSIGMFDQLVFFYGFWLLPYSKNITLGFVN
jgi:hypothetical protein